MDGIGGARSSVCCMYRARVLGARHAGAVFDSHRAIRQSHRLIARECGRLIQGSVPRSGQIIISIRKFSVAHGVWN